MSRLTKWLAANICPRREADFVIGPPSNPYLMRWWLVPRNPLLNVYLHYIIKSDDDRALHDHPWPSLSLMIYGELGEYYKDGDSVRYREIREGQWVRRRAAFAHRLVVAPGTLGAWTVFITGPRVRSWGFHCPQGWRHHREYTLPSDSGQVGRGCEG